MELRRRLDPRIIFVVCYVILFAVYLIVGLQPAGAAEYGVSSQLSIPAIGLDADVTTLTLNNNKLDTPDTIVGSYSQASNKTLLIGHSTTVFQNLNAVKLRDIIEYDGVKYSVINISMLRKLEVDMNEILSESERDTIIVMTCAGELLEGGDATHRLMLTAVKQ